MAIYDVNGNLVSDIFASASDEMLIQAAKKHFNVTTRTDSIVNNDNCFLIAHISDIHSDTSNMAAFETFCTTYASYINAKICTGDFVVTPTSAEFTAIMGEVGEDTLRVIGNHDVRMDNTSITTAQAVAYLGMQSAYYYVDYADYGIRLIVLDDCDTDNSTYIDKVEHYSQSQIDWLISTLQDAIDNELHVLIAKHTYETEPEKNNYGFYQRFLQWPSSPSDFPYAPDTPIEDIVHAFMTGGTLNKTYTASDTGDSITVSTTFSGSGTFIAYMTGHKHADMIGYSANYSDQLYLAVPCGVLVPDTAPYNYGQAVSDLPRVAGTDSEQCFNLYGIDTTNRLIRIVRIGACVNDEMHPRKSACFPY